ncbi:hypothetical protein DsansV1_C03g0031141 [Dioscorea sansibarensis]
MSSQRIVSLVCMLDHRWTREQHKPHNHLPSPHPSLAPLYRVSVRRNSRRVVEGSISESSNRSPLMAKTKLRQGISMVPEE